MMNCVNVKICRRVIELLPELNITDIEERRQLRMFKTGTIYQLFLRVIKNSVSALPKRRHIDGDLTLTYHQSLFSLFFFYLPNSITLILELLYDKVRTQRNPTEKPSELGPRKKNRCQGRPKLMILILMIIINGKGRR
jgi:hypothetical protein